MKRPRSVAGTGTAAGKATATGAGTADVSAVGRSVARNLEEREAEEERLTDELALSAAGITESLAEAQRRFEKYLSTGLPKMSKFLGTDHLVIAAAARKPLLRLAPAAQRKGTASGSAKAQSWRTLAEAEHKRRLSDPVYANLSQWPGRTEGNSQGEQIRDFLSNEKLTRKKLRVVDATTIARFLDTLR